MSPNRISDNLAENPAATHTPLPTLSQFADATIILSATVVALYFSYTRDLFGGLSRAHLFGSSLQTGERIFVGVVLLAGIFWAELKRRRHIREARARAESEQEIRHFAFCDQLTGLPNRHRFDLCLTAALNRQSTTNGASGKCTALILLDLNGFKRVNDVFGHVAGDEVLINVGERLRDSVRDEDVLARLGGDEFVVIAENIEPADVTPLVQRIFVALKSPISAAGKEHLIGASIGVSLSPEDSLDPRELFRKADIALYRAKEHGGCAVRFFEHTMDTNLKERDLLERELRIAMQTGEIHVAYQPIVDLHSGAITAFEALARWTSPTLGVVSPCRFITVAEEAGLIGDLTDLLLHQALAAAVTWPLGTRLAFNISAVSLREDGFADRIRGAILNAGLPPSQLEIEVTEGALVRDLDTARIVLGSLRDFGCRIVLDDFGTGYSSLYHLRNFQLDKIKIDQTFIRAMVQNRDSKLIVKALIGLGAGLGLQVVAEGVENDLQRKLLMCYCCDQAQGFYFSRPISTAAALQLAVHSRTQPPSPDWPNADGRGFVSTEELTSLAEGLSSTLLN